MNLKPKVIGVVSLISITLISLNSTSRAFTETERKIESNNLVKTVTLKQSEENEYFNNLSNEIEIDGQKYKLKSDEREKISESNENKKTISREVTLNRLLPTDSIANAKAQFNPTLEVTDEEGYTGELQFKNVQIETVPQGDYEKIEYLDIDFLNYSQNDLANISKEILRNGYTWNLINVDWEIESTEEIDSTNVPLTYKGIMHYQRIGTYPNPLKYRATGIYEGTVEAIDKVATYEVIYDLVPEEHIKEEPKADYTKPILIGAIGVLVILIAILSQKNCIVYEQTEKKLKKVKAFKLSESNLNINLNNKDILNKFITIKFNTRFYTKIKNKSVTINYNNRSRNINLSTNPIKLKLD